MKGVTYMATEHTIDTTTLVNMARFNHNYALCKKAAETLEEFAKGENTYVWIELPNGSIITLEPGFKIKTAEYGICDSNIASLY